MEELKEGTILCSRDWNFYNNEYSWEFETIKKITQTGKIRLENGDLLSSLGKYKIYDDEMEKLYIQDQIKDSIRSMIFYMDSNKSNIINESSFEDILKLGNSLEDLKIEDVKKWGNESNKKSYNWSLNKFKTYKNTIK